MNINHLFGTFAFRQTASQDRPYLGTVRGREEEATKLRLEMARSAVKYAEQEYKLRISERVKAAKAHMSATRREDEQAAYWTSLRRDLQDLEASIHPGAPK